MEIFDYQADVYMETFHEDILIKKESTNYQ